MVRAIEWIPVRSPCFTSASVVLPLRHQGGLFLLQCCVSTVSKFLILPLIFQWAGKATSLGRATAVALPLCRNATLIFAVDIKHDGRTEKDGVIFFCSCYNRFLIWNYTFRLKKVVYYQLNLNCVDLKRMTDIHINCLSWKSWCTNRNIDIYQDWLKKCATIKQQGGLTSHIEVRLSLLNIVNALPSVSFRSYVRHLILSSVHWSAWRSSWLVLVNVFTLCALFTCRCELLFPL